MDATNTRRWPRHHVHLPVFIAANTAAGIVRVPGLACELSRGGMELYGGLNLQPGSLVDIQFQIADKVRIGGRIRNRSGFCFGVEFRALLTDPVPAEPGPTPDRLEALIVERHEAYMRQLQREFEESMQTMLEMRKCRKAIERIADALNKKS
jgi:hypothetical protein